jgi:hypothetical protein
MPRITDPPIRTAADPLLSTLPPEYRSFQNPPPLNNSENPVALARA